MEKSNPYYPLSTSVEAMQTDCVASGIAVREKLAHDYLCAAITSGAAWTSDQFLIESVFNLADKFIEYANNYVPNKQTS